MAVGEGLFSSFFFVVVVDCFVCFAFRSLDVYDILDFGVYSV